MATTAPNISKDEWLKALDDAGLNPQDDPDAVTIDEFMAMFDMPRSTAEHRLVALVKTGKATETKKWRQTPYGRRIAYRAFRLT